MDEREKLRSESLNLLRFPLAIIILIVHVFCSGDFTFRGQIYSIDSTPIFREITYFIDGFIRGRSVPIYYFISGYVFFVGITLTKEKYIQKLKNRKKTLLIPYLIWNTVAIIIGLVCFLPCFHKFFPNLNVNSISLSPSSIFYSYWDRTYGIFSGYDKGVEVIPTTCFPEDKPLWFLRDLMIVVLTTPIIYWILKRTRYYFVCLLGLLWFVLGFWDLRHTSQLLVAYFYFTFGAYMSINKKDMLVEFGKYFHLSVFLYISLSLLYVAMKHYCPEANRIIRQINVFVGLIFAYNIATWLLQKKICKPNQFLASASFFTYVTHGLFCYYILKLLFFLFNPTTDLMKIIIYTLTVLITAGIILLMFWLMRKHTPNLLKVIAGRK